MLSIQKHILLIGKCAFQGGLESLFSESGKLAF